MENNTTSNEFVRGTLKTIVLTLLAEKDRMYGYEITQEVKDRTSGAISLTFGALYPVLHKLEQEGLLITESVEVDGRLRKYYSLTSNGNETARTKTTDLERFIEAVKLLLAPRSLATE
ncbi:PadR family transcriptional regulator [Dyadobacter sandarakinus]|uniref:PadR family transcriptional regulator n=1 Tax=Dyadobacter sandarakinus TaxID=2747268 RepID=A0ABX7I6A3_9BACT|nr:PadR family transcriptional regulator [Dyadobacter sandarakinus]QRR01624.1 PadR family transcriptional regulator [Dyadobacter sandarakinus]